MLRPLASADTASPRFGVTLADPYKYEARPNNTYQQLKHWSNSSFRYAVVRNTGAELTHRALRGLLSFTMHHIRVNGAKPILRRPTHVMYMISSLCL